MMKCLICLIIAMWVLPSAMPLAADRSTDEAAIRRVMDIAEEAYNKRDFKTMQAIMAPDFENWVGTHRGRELNIELTRAALKNQPTVQTRRVQEIGVMFVTDDTAVYRATWEFSGMVGKNAESLPPSKLLGAYVLAKRNGKWLMVSFFSRIVKN